MGRHAQARRRGAGGPTEVDGLPAILAHAIDSISAFGWTGNVPGADQAVIQRSDNINGPWTDFDNVNYTDYRYDAADEDHFWRVYATDSIGGRVSANSNTVHL